MGRIDRKEAVSDLQKVFDLKNLRRAYRWIMSNPDARYKSYFRDSYDAFAIASDTHLKWIRQEGLKERYQVTHASKLLLPKASGTLRPITLLTVEDQIVYQACVNLIADELKKRTKKRYEKRVFAHLYAGKSSAFFYMQWQRCYRKFGKSVKKAFADGFDHVANFDLASFYDSIDHHVLRHFLKETGIDEDTIDFLLDCLRVWTSSTWSNGPKNIYHEHGIPQGPLASGMLSEAVLQHIDEAGEQGRKTRYARYVDDIKIFAKSEEELRRKLIKLDVASKEIGLFPQTSKINIRKISDPNDEIKSVSQPPEPSLTPAVNQAKLVKRIRELIRRGRVKAENTTRFKYLVAHVEPTSALNAQLMKVLSNQPELAPTVCGYIRRYPKIPRKMGDDIIAYLRGSELYHFVSGALLRACLGKLSDKQSDVLGQFCADRLLRPKKGAIRVQPSYKEALIAWALTTKRLTFAEFDDLVNAEADWWVRKCSLRELTNDQFGPASYADLINRWMRGAESELARISSARMVQESIKLTKPYGDVETTAKQMLKAAKVIRTVGYAASRINEITSYILKRKQTAYDWKAFFGAHHAHAERMTIFLKRNRESNIDAFIVQMDSYCDLVTEQIYTRLKPGKTYPAFGAAIKDPVLTAHLPDLTASFSALHALRLESTTAHPRSKKTGRETRRLKHRDYYNIRKDIVKAFDELERKVAP